MRARAALAAILLTASSATAADFSEGSQAKEWGLLGEELAVFDAKVVDVLCELTGDCPENCGDGKRQLGLVRKADNALVLPLKNGQAAFSGAATDLAPYCGQTIGVDGVLVGDEDQTAVKYYMVQLIRPEGASEWVKANQWTKEWAKRNPDAAGKGPWFRRDPRILAMIEKEGYLGIGLEADKAFIEYLFE